jgi:hypothetical protein
VTLGTVVRSRVSTKLRDRLSGAFCPVRRAAGGSSMAFGNAAGVNNVLLGFSEWCGLGDGSGRARLRRVAR